MCVCVCVPLVHVYFPLKLTQLAANNNNRIVSQCIDTRKVANVYIVLSQRHANFGFDCDTHACFISERISLWKEVLQNSVFLGN